MPGEAGIGAGPQAASLVPRAARRHATRLTGEHEKKSRVEEHSAQSALLQAAHVARRVAETLLDRPLSVANTPFVLASFRALDAIQRQLTASLPHLPEGNSWEGRQLTGYVTRALREPTPDSLDRLVRFVRDGLSQYRALFGLRPLVPLAPFPFRGRVYTAVVAMIGPGIGIGDESKLAPLLASIRDELGLEARRFELYSFHPKLWHVLAPDLPVHDLSDAPLRAFERLSELASEISSGRVLALFGCFMRQTSLPLLSRLDHPGEVRPCVRIDGLELAISSGEVWMRFADDPAEYTCGALDANTPNFSAALTTLAGHLCASPAPKHTIISYTARGRKSVRLVVNPFTSKHSPLSPDDWGQFIACLRRGVPSEQYLVCTIVPGLTASCRQYAAAVGAAARQHALPGSTIRLLDDGSMPLTADNGIETVHRALTAADILLTIDTYTAHLAARLRIISIALCLNRNVHFWDPAPHTFWLNISEGYRPIATTIRAVARLASAREPRLGPLGQFAAACEELELAGHPGDLPAGPGGITQAASWRARADRIWRLLPQPLGRALTALDRDYAWPLLRHTFASADARLARTTRKRLAASTFFRLACLAAASSATRGAVR